MNRTAWLTAALIGVLTAHSAGGAELKLLLPLGRAAYQINEWIDLSVVRSAPDGLQAGSLAVTLTGEDGSRLAFTFAVKAVEGKPGIATEHLHLNGGLLRPGNYHVQATADGATAATDIEVHSHIRKSTFKVIDWASRASKHEQATLGEDSLGFNLLLYAYGGLDEDELIRGGLDYMRNCTMGGAHTMDLRKECDWSDPYVLGGGIARATRQAFQDRTNPNCLGVHLYDEPLLTEVPDPKDPEGKRTVRAGVPAQERSYRAVFGEDAPKLDQMDFTRPEDAARWAAYNRWRLLLLEAAWKIAGSGVTAVEPDYLTISQTQWAWQAFDAGYYFNVNRPFPVISRHALYDYKHGGDFSPSFAFEFGRIRDLAKPEWYLPMWGCGRNDLFRAEQYLSFIQNLQGIAKPPDLLAHWPSKTAVAQAVVESNRDMARLGTIFDTMPVTRPEVAVLYSMSHNLHEPTRDCWESYRGNGHFQRLLYLYMASKILHVPLDPVVDEDVLDGTLAQHKAVVLAGIDYLDPKVHDKLEAFAAGGGAVLLSDDSKVEVKRATRFHLPQDGMKLIEEMDRWAQGKHWDKWSERTYTNSYFKAAQSVAQALKPQLDKLGVKPVFDCDQPGIVASRQALGDIEYLFAVNATPDFDSFGWYFLKGVTAHIGFPADERPVYDALRGGSAGAREGELAGKYRFGPGQMRVWARTARPIGGVQVLTPVVTSDYTAARDPIRIEINAVLVDDRLQVLCGSAPLAIEVTDPLHVKRYDLYRATDRGVLRLTLPLAANDPPGEYTVSVRDLLSNHRGEARFIYQPPSECGAAAGATRRALCFGRDRENIFRFFRNHKELVVAKGTSKFNDAAAERLAKSLEPWDIRCKIVTAADVKPRTLTKEEQPTWVGLNGRDTGFDIRTPTVLLGNPGDNPLIRYLQDQHYLPYAPAQDQLPGRGRGFLAWQRDGLAFFGHESLTLIAYDEAGMAEAVGSTYEIAAGMEPLTPLVLPDSAAVRAAARGPEKLPEPVMAWRYHLPDRIVALRVLTAGVLALSEDGTLVLVGNDRAVAWRKTFAGGEAWALDVSHDGSLIALGAGHRLVGLDGDGNQRFDVALDPLFGKELQRLEGVGQVAVAPDGSGLVVSFGGYASGKDGWQFTNTLTRFSARGEKLWSLGGVDDKIGKPRLPDRYTAVLFSPDGGKLLLLADKKTQVLDAGSGSLVASLDGPSFKAAVPLHDDWLLADGEDKLVLLSPAQGKVVGQMDCGKTGPATVAAGAQGILVGSEADGAVRLVKRIEGKLDEQTTWKNAVPNKLVKQVAANLSQVAVSYWGGTLRVFDARGQLLQEQIFPQDVSVLAGDGRRWIVGLADGSLLALESAPP